MIFRLSTAIISGVLLVGLIGCAADRKAQFDESAFTRFDQSGTASVTGQAFLKTRGGDVKYGAGNQILLIPATAYTEEDFDQAVVAGQQLKPPPADILQKVYAHTRHTVCDGSGNFEFHSLPAGDYFLECAITWEVAGAYGAVQTGGMAYSRVTVTEGQTAKAIVTR